MSQPRPAFAARRSVRLVAGVAATALVGVGVLAMNTGSGTAAAAKPKLSREQVAEGLLSHRSRFMSSSQQSALRFVTGESRPRAVIGGGDEGASAPQTATKAPTATLTLGAAGVANVRVNDPAKDRFLDQTTQSETSIAVHGKNVAVGYNDSALVHPAGLTAAANLSGYSYSTDGGATFKDGGDLPTLHPFVNLGDPWLGSDRIGTFFYGNLDLNGENGNLEIGVAKSADGGATWGKPTMVSPNDPDLFYSGDKDALVVGRSKASAAKDAIYAAWDDFVFDINTGDAYNGLPVARSTDGGTTWALSYADKFTNSDPNSCSFGQYIGSQPIVDPANGDLYVVSTRIAVDDPTCTGGTETFSQVAFRSTDGGVTFGPMVTIADVGDFADIDLGPGKMARNLPLPTVTLAGGKLVVAWNEGPLGSSRILWSASSNQGATWSPVTAVPAAPGEDFQPALSSDASGLHLAYYHKHPTNKIDVVLADSANGSSWTAKKVTTVAFPGVFNNPQFDPIIAFGYMGDYIANVSVGGKEYLAWGDNRDKVTNVLWPSGRNDPDVFFAKR